MERSKKGERGSIEKIYKDKATDDRKKEKSRGGKNPDLDTKQNRKANDREDQKKDKNQDKCKGCTETPTFAPSISSAPSPSPTQKPSLQPSAQPQASPSAEPSLEPTFPPTTPPPTIKPGNPTPAPTTFVSRIKGYLTLRFSMLMRKEYHENIRRRQAEVVTAIKILSEQANLVDDVLISLMTVLCESTKTSNYVILSPASVIPGGNSTDYIDFCRLEDDGLRSATDNPGSLFTKRNTVILADVTGSEDTLQLMDRKVFIDTGDEHDELDWVEWGVTYTIVEWGRKIYQEMGSDAENANLEVSRVSNLALVEAWKSGALDELLVEKNDQIIVSSLIGSEVEVFSEAIKELKTDDEEEEVDNVNVDNPASVMIPDQIDDSHFFSAVRLSGISLFVGLIVTTYLLIHLAQKKREHFAWDAKFEGNLTTEEGVEEMLTSGRRNVSVTPLTQESAELNDSDDIQYLPGHYTRRPRIRLPGPSMRMNKPSVINEIGMVPVDTVKTKDRSHSPATDTSLSDVSKNV